MRLTTFKILSFDTYGTLIDWETGIYDAMAPLLQKVPAPLSRDQVLEAFGKAEHRQEAATPGMIYSELLQHVYRGLAESWDVTIGDDEAAAFGHSIKDWPAFEDTAEALKYLKQHYKLVTLTNCDRISYSATNARLGNVWDAIYTAQDIGSYKPDLRNFEYLLTRVKAEFGLDKADLLHVAHSLLHDHVPATEIGLAKAWIDRRHGRKGHGATAPPQGRYHLEFQFRGLAELADAHRRETAQ